MRVSSKRVFLRCPRILTTPPYKNSPLKVQDRADVPVCQADQAGQEVVRCGKEVHADDEEDEVRQAAQDLVAGGDDSQEAGGAFHPQEGEGQVRLLWQACCAD